MGIDFWLIMLGLLPAVPSVQHTCIYIHVILSVRHIIQAFLIEYNTA